MSTISSKPTKRYGIIDLIAIFVLFVLLFTLFVIPLTGGLYNFLGIVPRAVDSSHTSYSFSADNQYWAANCNHGWSSNSTCDDIVARSQSCSISAESAYCSEYDNYLKQFSN
jgi:hypothetical protein